MYSHDTFISPFTWRYGGAPMRTIWSLEHQRRLWRRIWVALAEAQHTAELVTSEQVADLRAHMEDIDLSRALEIEAVNHHDLMAEVQTYAEQCLVGGGIIHLGATSMDIEDNAEVLRMRASLDLILQSLREVLRAFAEQITREADHVCMAFTHLQPAEPTTVGYRLAGYAQDLLADYDALMHVRQTLKGKGFKGAVGTAASYHELLQGTGITPQRLEAQIMAALDLPAFDIAMQTYPRRQDWEILNALAGLAMSAYRFAFDLRVLQSPPIGEWSEPFAPAQVGSSAMPFKRNPIHAENIDSLARYLAALPRTAWDNAAHHLLERTLDDSGNRRIILPEAFLTADELLRRLSRIINGLRLNPQRIHANLTTYGTFAATERLLMAAARAGGNRQQLHETLREHSLAAWEALREGEANPLADRLAQESQITTWIPPETVRELLEAGAYVGDAPARARAFAAALHARIS